MTRRQIAVLHALLVLIAIVALALVTTWALLAIGEGTAAINLREYGAEFTFGGTFALFIGLIGIFVKTFKKFLSWLTVIILSVLLTNQFQQMVGEEVAHLHPDTLILIKPYVLYITGLFVGLSMIGWIILRPLRAKLAGEVKG